MIEIWKEGGSMVWSGVLGQDDYTYQAPGEGVYRVIGNKGFSLLIGDPLSQKDQGWHAVDQESRPLSKKFLTVMQGSWLSPPHVGKERFTVFAYYDNTNVTVRELETGNVIWTLTLDSLEHRDTMRDVSQGLAVSVEADKEVSVLSYGDCGYYVPAFNGTFTGRDFITFCGDMGNWSQALKVIPWADNTDVVVTDLDNPLDTLWKFSVAKRGAIQFEVFVGRFLKIHADKNISCALLPGTTSEYYHLVRSIDSYGLGLGKEFYIPAYHNTASMPAKLEIEAFQDSTLVKVFMLPDETNPAWSGTLDAGGHHSVVTDFATYKVEASRDVAVIEMNGGNGIYGVDFIPVTISPHPAVAAIPSPQFHETPAGVPTVYEVYVENNGNTWDVINIDPHNSLAPDFVTEVFDTLGGTLTDVDGDGRPDTDTLPKAVNFAVLVEITPAESVEVGTIDTCYFRVISYRDTTKQDTALLITYVGPPSVEENPKEAGLEFGFFLRDDMLYVSNPSGDRIELCLFDASGRRVYSELVSGSMVEIDVSNLSQGVYFVTARTKESKVTRKVVIR